MMNSTPDAQQLTQTMTLTPDAPKIQHMTNSTPDAPMIAGGAASHGGRSPPGCYYYIIGRVCIRGLHFTYFYIWAPGHPPYFFEHP
jgi:hypothetical protein